MGCRARGVKLTLNYLEVLPLIPLNNCKRLDDTQWRLYQWHGEKGASLAQGAGEPG